MWVSEQSEVIPNKDLELTHPAFNADKQLPDDIKHALTVLERLIADRHPDVALFNDRQALIAARAPGRLDVMGGIADYSGSTVLQLPLKESVVTLCQKISDPLLHVVSVDGIGAQASRTFSAPLSDFGDVLTGKPYSIDVMRHYFQSKPVDQRWAAYIAGTIPVLMAKCGLQLQQGIVLFVFSTVPQGKGVSSSAAVEVAAMSAVAHACGVSISAHQQAVLCQRVENQIVGAPCGLMDQMTSSIGRQGSLLRLLCQPDQVQDPVQLPDSLSVWGIDSGLRHAVTGADYQSVRVAAFMGYRLLLEMAGVASADVPAAEIVDDRWNGYLANVSVSEFTEHFVLRLPGTLTGHAFLERFDGITDTVTSVDPNVSYAIRDCTSHPIREHFRIRLFAQLLTQRVGQNLPLESAYLAGECMYLSHGSYSGCGLGSDGTDKLVEQLRAVGTAQGVYGARISGGGSGGTVAVLADSGADQVIRTVAEDYARESGIGGHVFSGSSNGASARVLQPLMV